MSDIMAQPYAEWLEKSLRGMVELSPKTIGIVCIMPDGTTGTAYYNADNRDRAIMCEAIMIDYVGKFILENADYLREILLEQEEDDGASSE